MAISQPTAPGAQAGAYALPADDSGVSLIELGIVLAAHRKLLIGLPLLAGAIALGVAFFVLPPVYTARTSLLPPQQQSTGGSSALASLGSLGALAGLASGTLKTPGDQYVALLQSTTLQDRLIDQFELQKVYDEDYKVDARKEFNKRAEVVLGKKDGLIAIEVDDTDPKRAAAIANAHVAELRRMSDTLAIGEAQQRRVFFEKHLKETRDNLTRAQQALEGSGFSTSAIRTEPKAAVEEYARLKAAVTSAEVRLQALRSSLSDSASEVRQAQAAVGELRAQLGRLEQAGQSAGSSAGSADYVGRYREFKYQETLFDLFARQYELARVDESREGALIQVVDAATPPEKKSKPKRVQITVGAVVVTALLLIAFVLSRHFWLQVTSEPGFALRLRRLRETLSRKR